MGYFFDAATGGPLELELRSIDGREFAMLRRIGYHSDDFDEPFIVPDHLDRFRTDLASVPDVFTWLVPRSGLFAPAAALHDAIVGWTPDYRGPAITRPEGDRIFRLAMQDLGTGIVRTWLMWAAVTMVTMWQGPPRQPRYRVSLIATMVVIVAIGTLCTLDLFDVISVVPWMGHRPWWQELLGGAAAAWIIPGVLAATWGKFWKAGLITCWTLAFLLHVTVALFLLYALYLAVERIVSGPRNSRGVHPELRNPTGTA